MPLIAASVRTLVVSWKDAADRKRFRCQRSLGDTHEKLGVGRLAEALLACFDALFDLAVCCLELADIDGRAGEQIGASGILDLDLAHHLADDDLDMLIVDINALLTVNLLDLLNDIGANAGTAELIIVDAADAQNIVRAECAAGQLLTLIDMVAVLDENTCRVRNGVDLCLRPLPSLVTLIANSAPFFVSSMETVPETSARTAIFFGLARLEQLFNTGKTLSDIVACDTAGVEGTHGKLSTRFADGLCRDNADGFA